MPKAARLLTVKEVNAITKPGLTAVGGLQGCICTLTQSQAVDRMFCVTQMHAASVVTSA